MGKIKVIGLILCLAVFFTASAAMIVGARDGVDTGIKASLSVSYGYSDSVYKGETVSIYRVADMEDNVRFTLTGQFKDLPIEVNKVKSQSEWHKMASTLKAYIISRGIDATATAITDEKGVAAFNGLETGLYLVSGLRIEEENGYVVFEDFMTTLPGVDVNDEWLYDVSAIPKSAFEEKTEEDVEYKVVKLWKDHGKEDKRPEEIEISIYRDGKKHESVRLSQQNNWTYTWKSSAEHKWTVTEENVENEYTVTVSQKEYTIYVTNSTDGPPPQTGESTNVYLIVALMSLGGAGLLLFGMRRKRGNERE